MIHRGWSGILTNQVLALARQASKQAGIVDGFCAAHCATTGNATTFISARLLCIARKKSA